GNKNDEHLLAPTLSSISWRRGRWNRGLPWVIGYSVQVVSRRSLREWGGNYFFIALLVSLFQLVERLDDLRQIYLVNLKTGANLLEQRDGQFATKVFTEFLQAIQHEQGVLRIHM